MRYAIRNTQIRDRYEAFATFAQNFINPVSYGDKYGYVDVKGSVILPPNIVGLDYFIAIGLPWLRRLKRLKINEDLLMRMEMK